ncbi:hypothetical protein [Actinoallomurus iriomotensis]|uniref:Uncharacterized protein n=1 Tax=Actinoallomurus iriomotensis TaxID=478107 RepID=A0A9W6VVQ8_9ACTN|nr:hypothetical protein [Actinoallomurus iriomotensis]GLY82055.1 hypothetical protein Airi01_103220 [Actinoallomurus iriomotensis]
MNIQPHITTTTARRAGLAAGAITAAGAATYVTSAFLFIVPVLPALGIGSLLITLGFILGRVSPSPWRPERSPEPPPVVHVAFVPTRPTAGLRMAPAPALDRLSDQETDCDVVYLPVHGREGGH